MLRPEQFSLHKPTGSATEYAALHGRLTNRIFVGRDTEVTFNTTSGRNIKAALRGHDSQALASLNIGEEITLWYATSAPHVIAA